MLAASSSGSAPRAIVPEIGQVSTRSPFTRTYISGDAPTRYSPPPRQRGAEVEQELERRRVPLAQPLVEPRRRRAPLVEHVAGDDLEQVAAPEPLLGLLHDRRVAAGDGLRRQRARAAAPARAWPPSPWAGPPSRRRRAVASRRGHRELVGVPDRLLTAQVDDPDLVRQVQHQVPLVVGPVDRQAHRLELERQVVTERPVQPQVRVRAAERGGDLPQHAEHGRPAGPLLLGERPLPLRHVDGHRAVGLLSAAGDGPAPSTPTRSMASRMTGSRTRPRSLSARAVTVLPRQAISTGGFT